MTTENNKIIAKFMGYIDNGCSEEGFLINPTTNYDEDIIELKFNSDWNWLMEVVQKIESLGFDFAIYTGSSVSIINTKNYPFKEIVSEGHKNKIESVYNACLEFIKWYNEQKKE